MNKRQIKKFCKKGGHYHFDKTIKRMSHKRLMHPYVTKAMFGHMVTWYEIGTCITCKHCTDVMVDWDGSPYAYYSTTIGCGGCGKFECKRYKLDKDLKFFKFEQICSDSPESDLKRYIDEQIKREANDSAEERTPLVADKELFDDESILEYLDQEYARNVSNGKSNILEDWAIAIIKEIWSTRPDVDINDKSVHYFVMHSDKAGIFEVGKKYLIKVSDKTTCAICILKNSPNEVTFLNAIVLEDEDPCICYEFSKSDGDEFLCSGDLIIKEDENG